MLVRLIYASRSTTPITPDVVDSILAKSRINNHATGITGALCVCHGNVFMQVLEGGRGEVNRLYAKVLSDPRHTDVILLDYSEVSERKFASWRMGRVDIEKVNPGIILRYSETSKLDPFQIPGKVAIAILQELMNTAAIVG